MNLFSIRPRNSWSELIKMKIVVKIKHALEFVICFFSRHDFIVSPEYTQQMECRRCHKPYAPTLRDHWHRMRSKPVGNVHE